MGSGFYLMHRGWLDNPAFGGKREPFCRRSAWAWLIEHAAYQEHDILVAGKLQLMARGQLYVSLRQVAKQWGWGHEKCRRFFQTLAECAMIDTSVETGQYLITICNYEKYQVSATNCETPGETAARQQRDSSETHKNKRNEGNEGEVLPPPIVPPHANGASNGRRKPRQGFPADWQPDDRGVEFALGKGRDHEWIARESERCRDHHRSKGNVFADLNAAWRTWVLNAPSFERSPGLFQPGSGGSRTGGIAAALSSFRLPGEVD